MIGQAIETGCRAIPGLGRWYLAHYVTIKRLEKRLRFRLGLPSPPSSVTLLVTYACNFGCDHCESSSHPKAEGGLPFETIARLIRELREIGVDLLIISGGEPLSSGRTCARSSGWPISSDCGCFCAPMGVWWSGTGNA